MYDYLNRVWGRGAYSTVVFRVRGYECTRVQLNNSLNFSLIPTAAAVRQDTNDARLLLHAEGLRSEFDKISMRSSCRGL